MNEEVSFILLILCIFFLSYHHTCILISIYIVWKCTQKSTGNNIAKQNMKTMIPGKEGSFSLAGTVHVLGKFFPSASRIGYLGAATDEELGSCQNPQLLFRKD